MTSGQSSPRAAARLPLIVWLRKLHLYLGVLFAPAILFFASTGALIVPVGLAYWAMRHAQVDRPGSCPIVLIRERDLAAARLIPNSATFATQVPNSRYLKVEGHWNRSRSNRWCFEYETVEATSEHHIGFIPLDVAVEKALAAVGAKVNVGLRRMTVIP